jgi:type 1 glutamine amidotransferase
VLVFTKAEGFRHASIETARETIRELGRGGGFRVTATGSASAFTAKRLRRFDAVVFASTTGELLAPARQRALRAYIRAGGGFAGIHAAADAEYEWPFYGRLVGASFLTHPPGLQPATVRLEDLEHPSTRGLPASFSRTEEWYDFRANPRGSVHVLATVDEFTYAGGTMGVDHPISWCQRVKRGRSWYTGFGHAEGAFAEPLVRAHLLGGIRWAAGLAKGSCRS